MSARKLLSTLPLPQRLLVYARGAHRAISPTLLFVLGGLACEAALLSARAQLGWAQELGMAMVPAIGAPVAAIMMVAMLRHAQPSTGEGMHRWAMSLGPLVGFGAVAALASASPAHPVATLAQVGAAQQSLALALACAWGIGFVATMCALTVGIMMSRDDEGSWLEKAWGSLASLGSRAIDAAAEHGAADPKTVARMECERLMKSLREGRPVVARKDRSGQSEE